MGTVAHGIDCSFRRANQFRNLRIRQFGMKLHKPGNGIWTITATGYRCIPASASAGLRDVTGRITDNEPCRRVLLTTVNLFHRQLSVGDRVEPDDPNGDLTISNSLNLKGMQAAKFSDLRKGQ